MLPEAPITTSGSDGKLDLGDSYLDGGGGSLGSGRKDLDSGDGDLDCGSSIGCPGIRKLDLGRTVFPPPAPSSLRQLRRVLEIRSVTRRRNKHVPQFRQRC